MNETYAELVVKRKDTIKTTALRVLLIVVAVLAFLLTISNSILLLVTALYVAALFYILPRLSYEYEYVYCDGQLDFDKIMGKSSRKNTMKVQFEHVVAMAPQGSHALDGYAHIQSKVKDFTSKDPKVKPYVLIVKENEKTTKVLFEPNQAIIDMVRHKYPRIVQQY